jgi:outer membrane lipoprotein-sorting protein
MKYSLVFLFLVQFSLFVQGQPVPQQRDDINVLVQKVKDKINRVNDYEANGKMKTNVVFLKVPVAAVKLYFKKPNRLRIKNEKGISFIPKGAVNMNLSNVLSSGNYSVLDAGSDRVGNTAVKVVKLLPEDDNADVVLSTLYIDAVNQVILKTKTTTRDNGTYELEMSYGKYMAYGLPDKIIFSFNTKDYKLPKGVTFDFEDGSQKKTAAEKEKLKNQKGKMEIFINGYTINKGIADSVFN